MSDDWSPNTDWNERLWRYFRPERFSQALRESTLYFASAPQFPDKFEGASAVMAPDFPVDPRFTEMDMMERVNYDFRQFHKISCWHRSEHENMAMWQIYASEHKGVAITSTAERLRQSYKPYRIKPTYGTEDLWAGPVEYKDLTQIRLSSRGRQRYFCKHLPFYWEREFRLLISLESASDLGVMTPDNGVLVEFDFNAMVESIMVGPGLTSDEIEMVRKEAIEAGLGDRIKKSSFFGRPRFI